MPAKSRPCARCKAMIPVERIEVVPETRLCIKCSQEVGGEFTYAVTQENLGKAGSIKRITGGVGNVTKTRKHIEPKQD